VPEEGLVKPTLFDFNVLQEYIIPRKGFFGRLVTVNDPDGKYAVLGLPVCIADPRYDRNEFIFNFGLVVDGAIDDDGSTVADRVPYERVVRRIADTFAEMEKQNQYLSRQGIRDRACDGPETDMRRPIESLLEIVKEDLNNYGECMIPVGEPYYLFFSFSLSLSFLFFFPVSISVSCSFSSTPVSLSPCRGKR
jgi:hypothetical protein